MKKHVKSVLIMFPVLFLFSVHHGMARESTEADQTLSPYFFVKSDDPELDRLPLKSTLVEVNIAGVIADVIVTQVYQNQGQRPLEAVYVFPASTKAAVYGMKMTIGERSIVADIQKRDAARKMYEQAKREGKTASLLEQQRPNVFQMNVANILPGDLIEVELKYTELMIPTAKRYEFVYPTVVGPRYAGRSVSDIPPSEEWVENPYLHEGEAPTYAFDIRLQLSTGLPIQEAACPSHRVTIGYDSRSMAAVRLDPTEKQGGNRDFILKYRLAGNQIESGLLLFEGEEENFFLMMIQPPERVSENEIPPREYIFIVDVSGSMSGYPLNISKTLLKDLIGRLRPTDRFNVLLFAGGSTLLSESSLPATAENVRRAVHVIDHQRGGGGTNLLPALKKALSLPGTEGFSRSVVIVTDGYVRVEKEAFDLIRNHLNKANVFPFGIGSSVNRYIIEGMARVGMGEPFVITRPEAAQNLAEKFRKMIQTPVLTNIEMKIQGFDIYDVEPAGIPDVMADRPVVVFGKWRGTPRGMVTVRGKTGENAFAHTVYVQNVQPVENNRALRYLWARHRIAVLSGYSRLERNRDRIDEVTTLGLTYNLLTDYTSFVAVDSLVRADGDKTITVRQPLPLPRGVSDAAVGAGYYSKSAAPVAALGQTADSMRFPQPVAENREKEGAAKGPARLELLDVEVGEGVSKKKVEELIKKNLGSLEVCPRAEAPHTATKKQKWVVRVKINAHGSVVSVSADPDSGDDRKFLDCLFHEIRNWAFPAPAGASEFTAVITLLM